MSSYVVSVEKFDNRPHGRPVVRSSIHVCRSSFGRWHGVPGLNVVSSIMVILRMIKGTDHTILIRNLSQVWQVFTDSKFCGT